MKQQMISIKSKIKDFNVIFTQDFSFINNLINIDYYVVVVGENVYRLYKDKIFKKFSKEKILVVRFGEENKNLKTVTKLYESLLHGAAKKNLTIISFGGGINQDVVGFTASTLYRGINWIYVPTTLLSMADSSIGSKTSLNFKNYKNVIGTFYPPSKVIINVDFLKTLSKLDYLSGIGEIIKLYMMKENFINEIDDVVQKVDRLLSKTNNNQIKIIINEAMKIKLSYMEGDEFDHGRRNLLNYGHEFGHALESSSNFKIPHGIAVIIGIIFANCVSLRRGLIKKEIYDNINKFLILPNVLHKHLKLERKYFDGKNILENMKKDKKRIGKGLVLVLPAKNFKLIKIHDLTIDEYESSLLELEKLLKLK
jgi:3-dehydroquinate synthase